VGPLTARVLAWDGLVNARDLGGLPLREGGTTRAGRVARADNVRHLTSGGWEQLRAYGARTVVDLRFDLERDADGPIPKGIVVEHVSLFGAHDPLVAARVEELVRSAPDAASATAALYAETLTTCSEKVATAVSAVGGAADGGVVVHCYVGKDRTGIVVAMLLELAGVEREAIVADYALTEGRVGSLVDDWIEDAPDPDERELRARISTAPAGAMRSTLDTLDHDHGGAYTYLRRAGMSRSSLDQVRRRLIA
jgi:protein-tyrosine phosphatase